MLASLALVGAVHLVTGGSFLAVGRALLSRHPSLGATRGALLAGAAWWWGLGAYLLIQAALTFLVAFNDGAAPTWPFLAARVVTVPLLCGAVWGLTYHLVYLFTGRAALAPWIGVLYGLVCVVFYYVSFVPMPQEILVDDWLVELEGTGEGPLYRLVYVAVGLPPIAASLAYLALLARIHDPLRRLRVLLIAGGILAWVGGGLAARLSGGPLLKFLTLTVLGLVAAGAVLLAYYPPDALVRRLQRGSPPGVS